MRDPNTYRDPEVFNPDRFPAEPDPVQFAFAFGRRRCPGLALGYGGGFSVVAGVLATFDILKPIEGMQGSGVQATAKHWLVNEQELNRETMSSDVPDRVLRELYVWPFADAAHSKVAAFMCR